MKRLWIFLALFVLLAFSAAAADRVDIGYTLSAKDITVVYVTSSGTADRQYEPEYVHTLGSVLDNTWTYDFADSLMNDLYDSIGNSNTAYGNYVTILFHINLDSTSYSSLDLSEYELTVTWSTCGSTINTTYFNQHLQIISANTMYPKVGVLKQIDLAPYAANSSVVNVATQGSYAYGSYTFPSSMTSTLLKNTATTCILPMAFEDETEVFLNIYLTKADASDPPVTDDPDEPSNTPEIYEPQGAGSFIDPLVYNYDYYFTISEPSSGFVSDITITDVYNDGSGYKFRDYTDLFKVYRPPLSLNGYDVLLGISLVDTESDAFVDSLCELFTVEFPCESATVFDDYTKYCFRMEWYFWAPDNFAFQNFKRNIEYINTNFYGLEPFSVSVGDMLIPFDFFVYEYLPSTETFKVTLELDGANIAHRNYMRAFTGADSIRLTFTSDWFIGDGVMLGITKSGFYKMYSDDVLPDTPDTPDTPSTGGFTQEDLDNAYNKGMMQGIAQGSDKNYVYGFVNGMWSGFNGFYDTVTNGLSLGGVTLNAIITSVAIVAICFLIVKKVT